MPRFLFLTTCAAASAILAPVAVAQTPPATPPAPHLFLKLPAEANTPDGLGLAPDGTLRVDDRFNLSVIDLAPR